MRREREAEPRPGRRLAAAERVDDAAQRGVRRQREQQPALHPHRVDSEQPALRVDERPAGRAARQRRGVLDRAAHAPSSGAAERAAGRGHEPERRAQPAAAGIGEREHGLAGGQPIDGVRLPGDRRRVAGVDGDHGDVKRLVGARDAAEHDLAAAAPDRDLVAAQHVRVRQHAAVADDDARAAAPAASEPDHRRPYLLRDGGHRRLQLIQETLHRRPQ
jgi:hypothetical protein